MTVIAAIEWETLGPTAGALGVFAWLSFKYMRQVLNSQAQRITSLEAAHRRCIQDHRAAESYVDELRGALVVQNLQVPPRPIRIWEEEHHDQ